MKNIKISAFVLVISLLLMGCEDPILSSISYAPYSKEASVDNEGKLITISHGIALGLVCSGSIEDCGSSAAVSSDISIVEVRSANVSYYYYEDSTTEAESPKPFVLLAKKPGKISLNVSNASGEMNLVYEVTVLDDGNK